MLTPIEAVELLNLCPICPDIQKKILMLFIGISGTYTSNIMKSQIKCPDASFNGSLVERIFLENDTFTLWRIKVLFNKGKIFNMLYINLELLICQTVFMNLKDSQVFLIY